MGSVSKLSSGWRFIAALISGVLISLAIGQGVQLISFEVSTLAAVLSLIVSFAATYLLKEGSPRREKPSMVGVIALLVTLATYLVIGRMVFTESGLVWFGVYVLAGAIIGWLVFTSVAETPLLSAFGIGGFCGGLLGVLCAFIFSGAFLSLMSQLTQSYEKTMVYTSIGLICAIPGAFGAVCGRLSGWGLAENKNEEVWGFGPDGRLYVRKDNR